MRNKPPTIPDKTYFRIGEVARLLGVKTHVLRYWETEFSVVSPRKSAANQRVYLRSDVEALCEIRRLLYDERYSIAGARLRFRRHAAPVAAEARGIAPDLREVRKLAAELQELAAAPISRLFQL